MTERKQQGRLDFDAATKLYILRELVHHMPHFRMVRVLRVIDDLHFMKARGEHYVNLTHREIAEQGGMSVPTVRRAIDDLIANDYLIKKEILTSYGQAANQYRIAWSNLDACIIDGESTQVVKVAGDHFDQGGDHEERDQHTESTQVVKVAGDHFDQGGDQKDQASLYPNININPPPPDIDVPSTWVEVEDILFSEFQVGRPRPAVEAAREAGCSIGEVLQLIEHARSKPGAYYAGAMYTRIKEASPGRDPALGWPIESDEYRRQQSKARLDDQQADKERADQEREERKRQERYEQQLLEEQYGPTLDEMSRDDLREFVAAHCPPVIAQAIARNANAHRSGGLYRDEILKSLKARQADCLDHLNSATADGSAVVEQR